MTQTYNKKKYFLLILLCFSPLINFILSNVNQLFFFSDFFLFNIIFINTLGFLALFFVLKFNIEKKNIIKLTFFLSFFWYLQFYYNDIKLFLNEITYDGYVVLFSLIIVSYFLTFFLFRKISLNFLIIFLTLNIFFKFPLLVSYISSKFIDKNYSISEVSEKKTKRLVNISENEKRTVFYVVLDEMPSLEYIENKLDLDISSFKNFASDNSIQTSYSSKSNYNRTYLTITSIFNLNYLPLLKYSNKDNFFPNILYKNDSKIPLLNLLHSNDFKFYFVGNEWARCLPTKQINCIDVSSENFFVKLINDYATTTFLSNSMIGNFLIGYVNSYFKKINKIDSNDAISKLEHYINNNLINFDENSFIFIHHLSPHSPYRSKNCVLLNGDERVNPQNFGSSVECVLNQIIDFTELINLKYPNSLIIFQGDHGHGNNISKISEINESLVFDKFSIFNSVYSMPTCKENLDPNFGQINTIRYVLRCLGFDFSTLEEKKYIGFSDKQDLFGQLYEIKD